MTGRKIKCRHCGKVLMHLEYGKLEIKCPRCGRILKYEYNEVMSSVDASEQSGQPALKK